VAQAAAPDARIVYVDNDPIVLSHARALLAGGPAGSIQYIDGDVRDLASIVSAAGRTLDLTRPTAVLLLGILHLIQDSEAPYELVSGLMDAMPSGSYLAISHPASDIHPGQAEAQRRYNERVSTPQTLRSRARGIQVLRRAGPGAARPGLCARLAARPRRHRSAGRGVRLWRRGPQALDQIRRE